jgi:hypothetical protein
MVSGLYRYRLPAPITVLPPEHGGRKRRGGFSAWRQATPVQIERRPGSTDHGAAVAGVVANAGIAGFQHFRLGKLRFSFSE